MWYVVCLQQVAHCRMEISTTLSTDSSTDGRASTVRRKRVTAARSEARSDPQNEQAGRRHSCQRARPRAIVWAWAPERHGTNAGGTVAARCQWALPKRTNPPVATANARAEPVAAVP